MVRNAQMWGGLFWLAIGGYVTWAGRDLGLGRLAEPGSGFAFFWIGLIMSALAVSVIAQAVLSGSEDIASLWDETRWEKVLLVTEDVNQNIYLAARNLPYIAVCDVSALDPVSLVDADHVVVTVESIKKIEEWLA